MRTRENIITLENVSKNIPYLWNIHKNNNNDK